MTFHDYLSTGCLHGEHDYCSNMVGQAGAKRPAQCKFCDAKCRCICHVMPQGWTAIDTQTATQGGSMVTTQTDADRVADLEDWIVGKGYSLDEVDAEINN